MNYLFDSKFSSILKNPFFIARSGLYNCIRKFAIEFQAGKLLDIGCGSKPYKHLFPNNEYVGLDIDNSIRIYGDTSDLIYDGRKFPIKDKEFDYFLLTQVLEHVFDPDSFLGEINRILKDGGKGIISVPFVWDEHEVPYDYGRYSSYGLEYLLNKNGFSVIKKEKSGDFMLVLGQLISLFFYYKTSSNRFISSVATLLINMPVQLFFIILSKLIKSSNGLYLDNIFLVEKKKSE